MSEPLDLDEKSWRETEQYYVNLGYFVEQFALCESDLHRALVAISGLDDPTARALLSGSRIDNDISFIRRIFEVRKEPVPKALDRALVQLAHINAFRNLLLHNRTHHWIRVTSTKGTDRGRRISNSARTIRPHAVLEMDLTSELFDCACEDLGMINTMLWAIIHPIPKTHWDPQQIYVLTERCTWRYRPPAQGGAGPKTPKEPRKQKAPRKS